MVMSKRMWQTTMTATMMGLTLGACTTPLATQQVKIQGERGVWINESALETLSTATTLQGTLPVHETLELRFHPSAPQVLLSTAKHNLSLAYQRDFSGRITVSAMGEHPQEVFVPLANGKYQRLRDNALFIKVNSEEASPFRSLLNQMWFQGSYRVLTPSGQATPQQVRFLPDGRVEGAARFTRYSLCLADECPKMEHGNSIALFDGEQWQQMAIEKGNIGHYTLLSLHRVSTAGDQPAYAPTSPYLQLAPLSK